LMSVYSSLETSKGKLGLLLTRTYKWKTEHKINHAKLSA